MLAFSQLWCLLDVSVAKFCLVEVTSKAPRPGICTRQRFGREGFLSPDFGPSWLDTVLEGLACGGGVGGAHGLLHLHRLCSTSVHPLWSQAATAARSAFLFGVGVGVLSSFRR